MKKIAINKNNLSRKVKIGFAVGAVAAGSILWLIFGKGKPVPAIPYYASRVIDGDTFVTREKQIIRIASTEAPELNLCGGLEAKKYLEELILGKPLYIKIYFRDPYQRLVSGVYTNEGLINTKMAEKGFSYFARGNEEIGEEVRINGDRARKKGIGIYSEKCTQWVNKEHPQCQIKGNVRNGKIYYIKGCRIYDTVSVQLYQGDKWFCNEEEAVKEGFRKGIQCP